MVDKRQNTEPRIITHGCRLNGYESEVMRSLSKEAGLSQSVIINSCAVTSEAVRRTRQSIRRARREIPEARIIVTGCAAQIDVDGFSNMPEVDGILGNQEKLKPESWETMTRRLDGRDDANTVCLVNDIMSVRSTAPHLIDGYGDRARAFLQIQNGCDHRCTFCIIPYGRGNSRSVPVEQVVEQARCLVDAGHRELVLTGVDITSYGPDLPNAPQLGDLVTVLLDEIPHLFRLRLSSIDGAEIDDILFDRIIGDERVAPYLHLSLQSGDDMILKRMKRRHTRSDAIEFCERVRARRPEVTFGADLIAGFPTENDAMFENSCKLIKDAGLSYVHVFPYSVREGTPAALMPQVAGPTIKTRAAKLREEATRAQHTFLDSLVGQSYLAVVEAGARARLGNFATVALDQGKEGVLVDSEPGSIVRVTVGARKDNMVTASSIENYSPFAL